MRIARIAVVPGSATVTEVTDRGATDIPIRQAGRYDDFAERLGSALRVPAQVHDGFGPLPGAGTLVACRPDVLSELTAVDAAHFGWVVALGLDRSRVVRRSVQLRLAAAVETEEYSSWVHGYARRPAAIYGRTDVAPAIGAVASTDPAQSGDGYARLSHPELTDLPSLLAAYLAAYAATTGDPN